MVVIRRLDAAARLGVCEATIDAWLRAGRLRKIQIGPRVVGVPLEDVDALLHADGERAATAELLSRAKGKRENAK